MDLGQLVRDLSLSLIFAVLGFILLFAGYRIFDALTPTSLSKNIFENNNVAAAILAGSFVLALAFIIAAAIRG